MVPSVLSHGSIYGNIGHLSASIVLWLAIHNRRWAANWLARRGLPHLEKCPLCDQVDETIQHVLTAYVFARQIWFFLFRRFGLPNVTPQPDDHVFSGWWLRTSNRFAEPVRHGLNSLVILSAWLLWKHRNNCVFNGATPCVSRVLHQARDEARLWCDARAKGLSQLVVGHD